SCLTRRLLAYFGEDRPAPCGHCARCLGVPLAALPPARERPLGPTERALVDSLRAENHKALSGPRPLARFLTGLSSPATTRAKLTRHPSFGALDDVPFARVVAFLAG
ncbi:MAG: RecQ family zinc-binding domain-containing protein, partial [Planctomycetia bacterium]|nr:RecQ family zinc-binding domain-containing protein [Planctomycetia bacterium]